MRVGVAAVTVLAIGCWIGTARALEPTPPPDAAVRDGVMRFLEERVRRDPDDFIAFNKLAAAYLDQLRERGDVAYLDLATRAARGSLAAMPAEHNPGGLAVLIQTDLAAHRFGAARDAARRLTALVLGKSYPYQLLGDALIELGDYDEAALAFREMERRGGPTFASEIRFGRLAALHGDDATARRRYAEALTLARADEPPSRETVAWCRWQVGEAAFAAGDYEAAERAYRDALADFPDYFRAVAALARVRAARGDLAEAIRYYERVVAILPDPAFVAALGDLYHLVGRGRDGDAQYVLCERMARLDGVGGAMHLRQLALFYADHDRKAARAYRFATIDFARRHDVYGADAVAWTALKAGRVGAARAAIDEALRLGTRDARLWYHAGMIARAGGDVGSARELLRRALALSPEFDPRQAPIARHALAELQAAGGS